MRINLINLCDTPVRQMPPLGLMYLSASIKRSLGVDANLLDVLIDPRDAASKQRAMLRVLSGNPEAVCICAYTEHHLIIRALVDHCRREAGRDLAIVIGGPHATSATGSCVRTLDADFVIRGRGEILLPHILEEWEESQTHGRNVRSSCAVIESPVRCQSDLALPDYLPDRRSICPDDYIYPFTMITSRGCPGRCTFCASTEINKGYCCPRSIDSICQELDNLVSSYGARRVAFVDDSFTHDAGRLEGICACLTRYGVKWFCESRIDSIDSGKLRLMAASGCSELQFGIECFEQELSDRIGKRIDVNRIPAVLKDASDCGIRVAVSLILGLPGDTVASMRKRIEDAARLTDLGVKVIEFSCLRPFPGTVLYRSAGELGYIDTENWWERERPLPVCFPSTSVSREELLGMLMYAAYRSRSGIENSACPVR